MPPPFAARWPHRFGRLALAHFLVTLLVVVLAALSDTSVTRMRPHVPPALAWAEHLLLFPVVALVYPDLKADSGDYRYVLFFALQALNSLVWAAVIVAGLRLFGRRGGSLPAA
jgi:hypothetical protein